MRFKVAEKNPLLWLGRLQRDKREVVQKEIGRLFGQPLPPFSTYEKQPLANSLIRLERLLNQLHDARECWNLSGAGFDTIDKYRRRA